MENGIMNIIETGKALTGNRLTDGEVLFLTRSGNWSVSIDDAAVALEPQSEAALEKRGQDAVAGNIVTEAYLIDVERSQGSVRPLHIREHIRASGPSVREDLGKQSHGAGRHYAALLW